jgi:nucleolar protein 56
MDSFIIPLLSARLLRSSRYVPDSDARFCNCTSNTPQGRISRNVSNKLSIAARIDCFSETPTAKFGEALRRQVEERIEFYTTGATPTKNATVMQSAMEEVLADIQVDTDPTAKGEEDVIMADGITGKATEQAMRKEKKKEKKDKKSKADEEDKSDKKSKKDKKRKHADEETSEKRKKKSKA